MLKYKNLHEYQKRAVTFILKNKRCCLFLDMGLGKTATTLTAVSEMLDSFVLHKVLIIAPLRVCQSVWMQEASKWEHLYHLQFSNCIGAEKKRIKSLYAKSDIYIINRENVPWLIERYKKLKKWPFDSIIIDESSSFKSPSAKRFKKLKTVLKYINVMILLTGTPSPNGLLDLWSQLYLIDEGASLGRTMTGYKKQFFDPDHFGYTWTPKPESDKKILNLIKNKVLSMTAKDYLQLPKKIDIIEKVQLPSKIYKNYKKFEKELIIKLFSGEELEAANVAVLANKLLQYSNGAIFIDDKKNWKEIHDLKLKALKDIVEDNPNENIIVAYTYTHDLIRIKKSFPDAVIINEDEKAIENWNKGKIKMLICHPASAGHGINLQDGGSIIIWFGLNWSLELYQQMNARVDRQGQTKPCRIIHIITENTIDEKVLSVLANKEITQNNLITALKKDFANILEEGA